MPGFQSAFNQHTRAGCDPSDLRISIEWRVSISTPAQGVWTAPAPHHGALDASRRARRATCASKSGALRGPWPPYLLGLKSGGLRRNILVTRRVRKQHDATYGLPV